VETILLSFVSFIVAVVALRATGDALYWPWARRSRRTSHRPWVRQVALLAATFVFHAGVATFAPPARANTNPPPSEGSNSPPPAEPASEDNPPAPEESPPDVPPPEQGPGDPGHEPLDSGLEPDLRPGGTKYVLHRFPTDRNSLSVTNSGALSIGMKVPTFPSLVRAAITPGYNSQGSDGVMGIGWSLGLKNVRLDVSHGHDGFDLPPDDDRYKVTDGSGNVFLKKRWTAMPGGPLVCEEDPDGVAHWSDYWCFSSPRTPTRYMAAGSGDYAESFSATDPVEGLTEHYGLTAASRIERDGQPVVWLLDTLTNREGASVNYYYTEDNDERLLSAILVDGDKTVRFHYSDRDTVVRTDYTLGVKRKTAHLLTSIELLPGCVPAQGGVSGGAVVTTFSGTCSPTDAVRRVKLTYKHPDDRFTRRYALSSWTLESGDGSVSYGATRFHYNGDTMPADGNGSVTSNLVTNASSSSPLAVPAGYALPVNHGRTPFSALLDVNRDGAADLVTTKRNSTTSYPQPDTANHRLYFDVRNGGQAFDRMTTGIVHPMARYSAWMDVDLDLVQGATVSEIESTDTLLGDRPYDGFWDDGIEATLTDLGSIDATTVEANFPEAVIGINSRLFRYNDAQTCEDTPPSYPCTEVTQPIFEGLSMSVPCERLGHYACDQLKFIHNCVWEENCPSGFDPTAHAGWIDVSDFDSSHRTLESYENLSVKVADLMDVNKDGYLDWAVSGLLVTWDPAAPDATLSDGFRDPVAGDPCIYVAHFDPDTNDFKPFVRYDVTPPTDTPYINNTTLLSTLGVMRTLNQSPNPGDMASLATAISGLQTISSTLSGLQGLVGIFEKVASGESFAGVMNAGASLGLSYLMTGVNSVIGYINMAPEVRMAVDIGQLGVGSFLAGMTVAGVASKLAQGGLTAIQTIAGVAAITNAVVGAGGAIASYIVGKVADHRAAKPGMNPVAISASARRTINAISITTAAVGVIAAGLTFAAATGKTVIGAFIGLIVALVGLIISVFKTFEREKIEWSGGDVTLKHKKSHGSIYKKDASGTSESQQLVTWTDMDGNGVMDLVVGDVSPTDSGFAVALGEASKGVVSPKTEGWTTFDFGSDPAQHLAVSSSDFEYVKDEVHRSDQTDVELALMDINGDRLPDVVQPGTGYGLSVHLNNGRGFDAPVDFSAIPHSAVDMCNTSLKVARSRGLSHNEFVAADEGWSVSLSTTVHSLIDMNSDGLLDLVMRDEGSFDAISNASSEPCVDATVLNGDLCDRVVPVKTEPEPGASYPSACDAGDTVWYANLDGDTSDSTTEGDSHLTTAAKEVFAPSTLADTYVAFNNGAGFDAFVRIDEKLPAFNGSMGVVSVDNTDYTMPNEAISGQTNFIAAMDGSEQGLFAVDIEAEADLNQTVAGRTVASYYRMGLDNQDAMVAMEYPDGGTATFQYRLLVDIQGDQGAPMWVMDRATYDDKVRKSSALSDTWASSGVHPFVEYFYHGPLLEDGEFRGFRAIAENRWSGSDLTQLVHTFYQHGSFRGAIECREVRGSHINNGQSVVPGFPEQTMCKATPWVSVAPPSVGLPGVPLPPAGPEQEGQPAPAPHPAPPAEPGEQGQAPYDPNPSDDTLDFPDDPGQFDACDLSDLATDLGLPRLYALQKRIVNRFNDASVLASLPDGGTEEIFRNFDLGVIETSITHGGTVSVSSVMEVEHDPPPFKTPIRSTVRTNDGIARTLMTSWDTDTLKWAVVKKDEVTLDDTGAPYLTRVQHHTGSPFFRVHKVEETWNGIKRVRKEINPADFSSDGLPEKITADGITTHYEYYSNGLLKSRRLSTDAFMTDATSKAEYVYGPVGELVQQNDFGAVTTWTRDGLGLPTLVQEPDTAPQSISYHDATVPKAGRSSSSLGSAARTTVSQTVNGETVTRHTYWDGFFRKFREGVQVDGPLTLSGIDHDGSAPGHPMYSRTFNDSLDFFTRGGGSFWLTDYRLNGYGEQQCRSLPYFDGHDPEAWASNLYGPLRRQVAHQDPTGFLTRSRYTTAMIGGLPRFIEEGDNGLGQRVTKHFDGLEREVFFDQGEGVTTTSTWDLWVGPVKQVDGRGFASILELNGWSQLTQECRQVNPGASGLTCPTGWPTMTYEYDSTGRKTKQTDPRGHATTFTPSVCKTHGEIGHPSTTVGTGLTSTERFEFHADCSVKTRHDRDGTSKEFVYDGAGRLATTIRHPVAGSGEAPTSTTTAYDLRGRALYVEDARGFRAYSIHDFRGALIRQLMPHGAESHWTYDARGYLASMENPNGQVLTYSRDHLGRVEATETTLEVCDPSSFALPPLVTTPEVSRTELIRDAKGRLLTRNNADGSTERFEYDDLDRMVRAYATKLSNPAEWDPGVFWEKTFDAAGNIATTRDREGYVTEFDYDGHNRMVSKRVPGLGGAVMESRYGYDLAGNLEWSTTPNGHGAAVCTVTGSSSDPFRTTFEYGPTNLVTDKTLAADEHGTHDTLAFGYDAAGNMTSKTDAAGRTVEYEYDDFGRGWLTRNPDGTERTRDFDATDNILTETDERGVVTSYTYDGLGRKTRVQTPTVTTAMGYTPGGQVAFEAVEVSPGLWQGNRKAYTTAGTERFSSAAEATIPPSTWPVYGDFVDLSTEAACQDIAGRGWATEDAEGAVSHVDYDTRGRVATRYLPLVYGGGTFDGVDYAYDDENRVVTVDHPFDYTTTLTTEYGYDPAGRKVLERFSRATAERIFGYDGDGNLCGWEDYHSGVPERTVVKTYDGRGREIALNGTTMSPPSVTSWHKSYDSAGRVAQVVDDSGFWDFGYDMRDRVTSQSQHVSALGTTFVTNYTWTDSGALETASFPVVTGFTGGPSTLTYTHDATPTNRIDSVDTDLGPVMTMIGYDDADRMVQHTLGNGAIWNDTYDDHGRLKTRMVDIGGFNEVDLEYAYDNNGSPTSIIDHVDGAYSQTLTYDERQRLHTVSSASMGGTWTYWFNDNNMVELADAPVPAKTKTLRYTTIGNLYDVTENGVSETYLYDDFGQRTRSNRTNQEFGYDALGRQATTLDLNTGANKPTVYAENGRRVVDGNRVYLYSLGRLPVAELELDPTTGAVSDVRYNVFVGERLTQQIDGSTGTAYYFAHDAFDAPILASDATAAALWHRAYDPFGKPLARGTGGAASMPTEVGFQSNYRDERSGLTLMHHRRYDDDTYQFTTTDPIGLDGSWVSRTAFADGQPTTHHDRSGLLMVFGGTIEIVVEGKRLPWYQRALNTTGGALSYAAAGFLDGPKGLAELPGMYVGFRDYLGDHIPGVDALNTIDPAYWTAKGGAYVLDPVASEMGRAQEGYYAAGEYLGVDRNSTIAYVSYGAGAATYTALETVATGGVGPGVKAANVGARGLKTVATFGDDVVRGASTKLDDVGKAVVSTASSKAPAKTTTSVATRQSTSAGKTAAKAAPTPAPKKTPTANTSQAVKSGTGPTSKPAASAAKTSGKGTAADPRVTSRQVNGETVIDRTHASISVDSVSSKIKRGTGTTKSARTWVQSVVGKADDDAGHLIARALGGKGGKTSMNIIAQNRRINRGAYRVWEKEVREFITSHGSGVVDIKLIYASATDTRPIVIIYNARAGGQKIARAFLNP